MKSWLIFTGYRVMWRACPPLPESLYDWYFDHIYAPWIASIYDACDDCPNCRQTTTTQEV